MEKKKLEIKRVTLRNLDSAELTHIAGGASEDPCPTGPTVCQPTCVTQATPACITQ